MSYIEDPAAWRSGFSFSVPIKIRFSETDMLGHVNNVSPFIYFEEGRIEFLKSIGFWQEFEQENGLIPVAADIQCDYHKQMFFGDAVRLYVKVAYIGTTSLDIHYMIVKDQEEITVTGRGRLVCVDTKTGKPQALSTAAKAKLHESHQVAALKR
ncbi:thioesterase family protein [Lentibacillus sediminis]|uniref:acyl-CoA thioesterase n=1 Tax=Lentibacillus sediminis TaxID=1940529 RepID=UPI0030843955